jgi:hypothetical protein
MLLNKLQFIQNSDIYHNDLRFSFSKDIEESEKTAGNFSTLS